VAVRGQWRVENSLHRVLDVTFREDWNCNGFAPVRGDGDTFLRIEHPACGSRSMIMLSVPKSVGGSS
jgi:hypothetical protein